MARPAAPAPSSARRAPAVIGLDIGTSAVKGLLVADGRRIAARDERRYPLSVGPGGRVEVDGREVLAQAMALIASLARAGIEDGLEVRAICAGGSGDEAVWLDASGEPVAPVPMALDTRSQDDGQAFAALLGEGRLVSLTGLPSSGAAPAIRLRWLERERPDLRRRVRWLLAWPEYLAFALGVEAGAEPTLAARTAAYGIREGRYLPELLAAAGLDPGVLAPLVATGAILGRVAAGPAAELGLGPAVSVVAGGFDQAMATLGAGIRAPGGAHVGAGTWEAVTVLADALPGDELVRAGYSVGPSIGAGGRWSVMASGPGASALTWLGRLGGGAPGDAARRMFALASLAPDEPTGLLVLPNLDGAAAPAPDRAARAVVAGLDLATGAAALALAMLEGIAFDLSERLGHLASAGHPVDELRVSGGGARDRRWLQLKADVTGIPVRGVDPADAGSVAAAALAARALGIAGSLAETVDAILAPGPLIEPRVTPREAYLALADRRRALRASLAVRARP